MESLLINAANTDPSIPQKVIDLGFSIVRYPKSLVGQEFIWVSSDDDKDDAYCHRVVKQRNTAEVRYKTFCWSSSKSFDLAEEKDIVLFELITDYLRGNLWFL